MQKRWTKYWGKHTVFKEQAPIFVGACLLINHFLSLRVLPFWKDVAISKKVMLLAAAEFDSPVVK